MRWRWLLSTVVICLAVRGGAAAPHATYQNPILPGFNPDPGFLRVGDDYFIVTSSFEFFPCFPIYHSKDLVNWQQIGNVLDRPSQISLDGVGPSDGLFSPVMRSHDGKYYLTFTMLKTVPQQHITNYLVTADHPGGPWSDPIVITDDPSWRIDTSLFFDDDGKCYFTANRKIAGPGNGGKRMIVLQEFDLKSFKLVGDKHDLGSGAFPNSGVAEGAHLYKKDGWYYLLMAEGGTGFGHAVSISRSRAVAGPYEQCPANPILTHRGLSPAETTIHGVGHGEIVETQTGQWFMALLGTRGRGVLGRETFLVPAPWDKDQWPVIAPGTGRVLPVEPAPDLPPCPWPSPPPRDDFHEHELGPEWLFIRVPTSQFWSLDANPGNLRLNLLPATFREPPLTGTPAFISKRLTFDDGEIITKLDFTPASANEFAGLLLRRGTSALFLCKIIDGDHPALAVIAEDRHGPTIKARAPIAPGPIYLKAECHGETHWTFAFSPDGQTWTPLGPEIDGSLLDARAPGGEYTGATVGPYATSQGHPSTNHADFAFFECRGKGDGD